MSKPQAGARSRLTALAARFTIEDMTQGNPYRLLLLFSVPMLIGNVFQQLYNTVDSIVVGQFTGHKALAAVGNGFPFLLLLSSLFIGVGMGAMVIISQFAGAKQQEDLARTVSTIYRVMLIGVVPFSLLGILLSRPVLIMMQVPNDGTLDLSVLYLQVIFAGLIGQMGYNMNAGLLQGMGDSMTSLLFLIVATVANIVLDLLLAVVLDMGVLGVALATVSAQFISWILGIRHINRKYPYMRIDFRRLEYHHDIFVRALRLGIPSGLQNALFSVGIMVIGALVNQQGSVFAAGYNAANKIDTFVFMPVQSFATAITTFTGQNLGARNTKRIFEGSKAGMILTVGISLLIGLALYPFSASVMGLFTPQPEVVQAGVYYLASVLPFFFILAALFVVNSVLRGVGRTFVPMLTTFISLWLVRLPLAALFVRLYGKEYLYYSHPIAWLFGLILALLYYYFGSWRKNIYAEMERYVRFKPAKSDAGAAAAEAAGTEGGAGGGASAEEAASAGGAGTAGTEGGADGSAGTEEAAPAAGAEDRRA